jgi:hypothetical protein
MEGAALLPALYRSKIAEKGGRLVAIQTDGFG